VVAYDDLTRTYPTSPLIQAAQRQVGMLFADLLPRQIATTQSCSRIDSLLENGLFPHPDTHLPPFYFACGQAADAANDPSTAYTMYERLLVGFSSHALAQDAAVSLLANPVSCDRADSLQSTAAIADRPDFLPTLYVRCGRTLEAQSRYEEAFTMYVALLTDHPDHPLVGAAISALPTYRVACERVDYLESSLSDAQRAEVMPLMYSNCGQAFEAEKRYQEAFTMCEALLTHHAAHPLADAAAAALLASETACQNFVSLKDNEAIADRPDFLPQLYNNCGSTYEAKEDYAGAIRMYRRFLAEFPEHTLAAQVEAALARSIVENLPTEDAGTLPSPKPTGQGSAGVATVVIRNDSPERIRLAFSGPDGRVVELESCPSCTIYRFAGPVFCPAKGPVGRYTFKPGQYNVVVESMSDSTIKPFKGTWSLAAGRTYSHCFYIVTVFE
jgi:tetratricopeptide (TPR) repeat protein